MSPQLEGYIKENLGIGISTEVIKGQLLASGWKAEEIDAAFLRLKSPVQTDSAIQQTQNTKSGSWRIGLSILAGIFSFFLALFLLDALADIIKPFLFGQTNGIVFRIPIRFMSALIGGVVSVRLAGERSMRMGVFCCLGAIVVLIFLRDKLLFDWRVLVYSAIVALGAGWGGYIGAKSRPPVPDEDIRKERFILSVLAGIIASIFASFISLNILNAFGPTRGIINLIAEISSILLFILIAGMVTGWLAREKGWKLGASVGLGLAVVIIIFAVLTQNWSFLPWAAIIVLGAGLGGLIGEKLHKIRSNFVRIFVIGFFVILIFSVIFIYDKKSLDSRCSWVACPTGYYCQLDVIPPGNIVPSDREGSCKRSIEK